MFGVDVHDNSGDGFRGSTSISQMIMYGCLFTGNGGKGINSVSTSTNLISQLIGNVIAGNTSDGALFTASAGAQSVSLMNNVFWGNGGWNIICGDTLVEMTAALRFNIRNAFGGSVSGDRSNYPTGLFDVSLTGNPFTNSGSRNFAPNNTAGAGALLRAAAFPSVYPGGATTNYQDIGVQHQDSGGSGSAPGGGDLGLIIQARQMIPY